MTNPDYDHHVAGVIPPDRARGERPGFAAVDLRQRPLRTWGATLFMVFATGFGMIALTCFADHVSMHDHKLAAADEPGAGMIIRSELRQVWLSRSLLELAKRESLSERFVTFDDFKTSLEIRDQENTWYAVTFRSHRADGNFGDLTIVRRPYHDPGHFPEIQTILDMVAANPIPDPSADISKPLVCLLPEELLKREPREAMAELLGHPVERQRSDGPDGS